MCLLFDFGQFDVLQIDISLQINTYRLNLVTRVFDGDRIFPRPQSIKLEVTKGIRPGLGGLTLGAPERYRGAYGAFIGIAEHGFTGNETGGHPVKADVVDPGPGFPFGVENFRLRRLEQSGYVTLRVIEIAEVQTAAGTRLHASGQLAFR